MAKYLELTRYLYWKDEINLSFIYSLLRGDDLNETLFWIYEIYYSGYQEESFNFILKIYYDFYSIFNPKLSEFITNNFKLWKQTKNDNIIGYTVKNLFGKQFSLDVFYLRQYMENNPCITKISKGRKPNWLNNYSQKHRKILYAIDKWHYENICFFLKKTKDEELSDLYQSIVLYFKNKKKIPIKDGVVQEIIESWNDNLVLYCKKHYILSIILYLSEDEENINKRKLFVCLNDEEYDEVVKIQTEKIKRSYQTLCFKRIYSINNNIGSFKLARENFENIEHEMWFRWLYHASNTPIWNKRLNEFKYSKNNDIKEIEFEDDDVMEEFYSKYGFLEPDEQPRCIQEAATREIKINSWKLFDTMFNNSKPVINFEENFRFIY